MKYLKIIIFLSLHSFSFGQIISKQKRDSVEKGRLKLVTTFLNLKPEDKIADIGTGSGYKLVQISNECPSCTFDVEDIDSLTSNKTILTKWIYKAGNLTKIENFKYYYGDDTTTNMPSNSYNKVLIFNVIHEFTYKKKMLDEIKRILKKDGQVFIEEILVHKKIKKNSKCNYPFLLELDFKKIMEDNNFLLKREITKFDAGINRYIKVFEYVVAL